MADRESNDSNSNGEKRFSSDMSLDELLKNIEASWLPAEEEKPASTQPSDEDEQQKPDEELEQTRVVPAQAIRRYTDRIEAAGQEVHTEHRAAKLPPPEDDNEEEEYEPAPRHASGAKVALYIFCVLLAAAILALGMWLAADDVLALTKPDRTVTVTIDKGDNLETIAQKLKDNGLIEYKKLFLFYGNFSHAEDKIAPGTYELNNLYDYHALVVGMETPSEERTSVSITVPEGYELSQIFDLLAENGICTVAELDDTAANYQFDYEFLQNLPYGDASRLEGYLFPDTYEFYADDTPENVIDKFLQNFSTKFDSDMIARIDELNDAIRDKLTEQGDSEEEIQAHLLDEGDIVIIASLIEKEAAISSERTAISSVIYNRLTSELYPKLEIDATIQYVLSERKEVLTYDDLKIDSPYNTYLYEGLPVGAICNPGLGCLRAALYPADTDYYFYALGNDGVHHFFNDSIEQAQFVKEQAALASASTSETAEASAT